MDYCVFIVKSELWAREMAKPSRARAHSQDKNLRKATVREPKMHATSTSGRMPNLVTKVKVCVSSAALILARAPWSQKSGVKAQNNYTNIPESIGGMGSTLLLFSCRSCSASAGILESKQPQMAPRRSELHLWRGQFQFLYNTGHTKIQIIRKKKTLVLLKKIT